MRPRVFQPEYLLQTALSHSPCRGTGFELPVMPRCWDSHQSSPYWFHHLSLPCKIHVLETSSSSPESLIFRFAFILLSYPCDPFYLSFKMKICLLFSFHFQGTGHSSQSMHVCKYCHTAVTLTCLAEGFLTQTNDTGADWDHHCQLLPHQ